MLNGSQVFAIVCASDESRSSVDVLSTFEANAFVDLALLITDNRELFEGANSLGRVARLVQSLPSSPEKLLSELIDDPDGSSFIEGNPYVAFFDLRKFEPAPDAVAMALLRLSQLDESHTISGDGVGLGRLSAFWSYGRFDGPNSSQL